MPVYWIRDTHLRAYRRGMVALYPCSRLLVIVNSRLRLRGKQEENNTINQFLVLLSYSSSKPWLGHIFLASCNPHLWHYWRSSKTIRHMPQRRTLSVALTSALASSSASVALICLFSEAWCSGVRPSCSPKALVSSECETSTVFVQCLLYPAGSN